jgi:hypothetical protein
MNVLEIIQGVEERAAARATDPELPADPLYVDPENPEVTSGCRVRLPWRIETEDAAEWALRRKAEHDQEIARIKAQAAAAKAWIDRRTEKLVQEAEKGASFFEAVIHEWLCRCRSTILRGKTKSKKLLFGTVGFKASREKLEYDDEKKALEWARAQGVEAGLYRVEFKLEKDAVKLWAKSKGIVPPGARWVGGADEPYCDAEAPTIPQLPAANEPQPANPQAPEVKP